MPAEGSLDVATPERVALSLPLAGVGSRALAYLIDVGLLFLAWITLYFAASLIQAGVVDAFRALSGFAQTVAVVAVFGAQWVYWTACEVLWRGQTVGKKVMRIRVVREDGAPVGTLESAVRNLCRVVDFLPAFYAIGILCMLFSPRQRRLGDLLAGTVLIRDERVDLAKYASPNPAAAQGQLAPLDAAEVELVLGFLTRASTLDPGARQGLAQTLVDRFGRHLSAEDRSAILRTPEGTATFLSARARGG